MKNQEARAAPAAFDHGSIHSRLIGFADGRLQVAPYLIPEQALHEKGILPCVNSLPSAWHTMVHLLLYLLYKEMSCARCRFYYLSCRAAVQAAQALLQRPA